VYVGESPPRLPLGASTYVDCGREDCHDWSCEADCCAYELDRKLLNAAGMPFINVSSSDAVGMMNEDLLCDHR
jgi:hypothetical protein